MSSHNADYIPSFHCPNTVINANIKISHVNFLMKLESILWHLLEHHEFMEL